MNDTFVFPLLSWQNRRERTEPRGALTPSGLLTHSDVSLTSRRKGYRPS